MVALTAFLSGCGLRLANLKDPDARVLAAEGGGRFIPGSQVTLRRVEFPGIRFELRTYLTTKWRCFDAHQIRLPGDEPAGLVGGCGSDPEDSMPISSGGMRDDRDGAWYNVAFGTRTPAGTALVRLTLDSGQVVEDQPVGGAWLAIWQGSPHVQLFEAIDSESRPIRVCPQAECPDE